MHKEMCIDLIGADNMAQLLCRELIVLQQMCGFTKQQARSVIDKMRSQKLISLSGKETAARYVKFVGLSGN